MIGTIILNDVITDDGIMSFSFLTAIIRNKA